MKNTDKIIREIKVTLPLRQAEIVQNSLVDLYGNNRSDVLAKMVCDWLVDRGFIKFPKKKRGK